MCSLIVSFFAANGERKTNNGGFNCYDHVSINLRIIQNFCFKSVFVRATTFLLLYLFRNCIWVKNSCAPESIGNS